ncbi:hypothetical protein D918_09280 [Trichuris suis]|nr:hypothetical protein D918_09280 [Trichuris suis]
MALLKIFVVEDAAHDARRKLRAPSESRRSRWLIGQRRRDGALVEMEKKTPKKEKTNLQEFEGSVKGA